MTGQGLAMRYRLRALQRRYQSRVIPLSDPTPHDMDVEGYASTTDLDLIG